MFTLQTCSVFQQDHISCIQVIMCLELWWLVLLILRCDSRDILMLFFTLKLKRVRACLVADRTSNVRGCRGTLCDTEYFVLVHCLVSCKNSWWWSRVVVAGCGWALSIYVYIYIYIIFRYRQVPGELWQVGLPRCTPGLYAPGHVRNFLFW
jgi:hypothetical protein